MSLLLLSSRKHLITLSGCCAAPPEASDEQCQSQDLNEDVANSQVVVEDHQEKDVANGALR